MGFIVSQKDGPHGVLLVITDEELIGKYFEDSHLQLDLRKKFYCGKKADKTETIDLIKGAQHLHFTGKAAVALGIELDLINAETILYIKGIPHAETVQG